MSAFLNPEKSPRQLSKEVLLNPTAYDDDLMLEVAANLENTKDALEFIKPLHYARLAQTIDILMEDMESKRDTEARAPSGFLASEFISDDPWRQLRSDTLATVTDSLDTVVQSPVYKRTAEINSFIGSRDSNRYINLYIQLIAGTDTAASSMLTLLRNIPRIAEYHGYDSANYDHSLIARGSFALPAKQAMSCVDRMMGAQTALSGTAQHQPWSRIDVVLDPNDFVIRTQSDKPAIFYKDFAGLVVPEGCEVGPDHYALPHDTKLGDLDCYQSTTVGCPVTLLSERMRNLWNWYIDASKQFPR